MECSDKKRRVHTEAYLSCMRELLDKGQSVSVPVTGGSMSPFLANGRDWVRLEPVGNFLKKGKIALYQQKGGRYLLHRVCRIENGRRFYFIGDAQTCEEGPIEQEQIAGVVGMVYRKGQWIGPGDFWWEFFEHIWLHLIPMRRKICSGYGWLKRGGEQRRMEGKVMEQQFLSCLKAFLTGGEPEACAQTFTEKDWEELLLFSEEHKVVPMIYEGISRMKEFQDASGQWCDRFRNWALAEVVLQTQKDQELNRIYGIIREKGYDCLILKGKVCRELYSFPDHRISGDEDLLVRPEDRYGIHQILLEDGYQRVYGGDGEDSLTWNYEKEGGLLYIEVHQGFFPDGSLLERLNKVLEGGFERRQEKKIGDSVFQVLDSTDEFIYLALHALKHFISCGVGIRQICDILKYACRYEKEIRWEEAYRQLEAARALKFVTGIFKIGEHWLGIKVERPWPEMENIREVEVEVLLKDILTGGVYGKSSESRIASGTYSWLFCNSKEQKGMNRLIVQRLFPGVGYLKNRYPILSDRPYLLPFFWIHRICIHIRKVSRERKGGQKVLEGIRLGSLRIQLLEQYEIPVCEGRRENG